VKKLHPPDDRQLADCYTLIATCLLQSNKSDQAVQYYEKCMKLKLSDEELARTQEALADCFFMQKKYRAQSAILRSLIDRLQRTNGTATQRLETLQSKLSQSQASAALPH
jgi:hypothetical protein